MAIGIAGYVSQFGIFRYRKSVIPAVKAKTAASIHKVLAKAVLKFYSVGRPKKPLTAEHAENGTEMLRKPRIPLSIFVNLLSSSLRALEFLCVLCG
jgi:hypothetical protein